MVVYASFIVLLVLYVGKGICEHPHVYTKCGGELPSDARSIAYPAKGKYKNNEKCVWTSANDKQGIILKYTFMDTERCYDKLQYGDGGERICGTKLPKDAEFNPGAFKLTFTSDGSVTKKGFKVNIFYTEVFDECANDNGGCSQICIDKVEGYECSCNTGYVLGKDKTTCTDGCATDNGGCSQVCINKLAGVECSCNTGYVLGKDMETCTDDDECSRSAKGGCSDICVNTPGSYVCKCPVGYVLKADGRKCRDSTVYSDCGGVVSKELYIKYPERGVYDEYEDCTWTTSRTEERLLLRFLSFDVLCQGASVEIKGKKFCGAKGTPRDTIFEKGTFNMKFSSGFPEHYWYGFRAALISINDSYTVPPPPPPPPAIDQFGRFTVCGGDVPLNASGVKYPGTGRYEVNENCRWKVDRPNKTIVVSVVDVSMGWGCTDEYDDDTDYLDFTFTGKSDYLCRGVKITDKVFENKFEFEFWSDDYYSGHQEGFTLDLIELKDVPLGANEAILDEPGPCYESNIAYEGTNIRSTSSNWKGVGTIKSWQMCRSYCAVIPGCKVYLFEGGRCYAKSEVTGKKIKLKSESGHLSCDEGKDILKNELVTIVPGGADLSKSTILYNFDFTKDYDNVKYWDSAKQGQGYRIVQWGRKVVIDFVIPREDKARAKSLTITLTHKSGSVWGTGAGLKMYLNYKHLLNLYTPPASITTESFVFTRYFREVGNILVIHKYGKGDYHIASAVITVQ